jgi:hypothetical protein
VDSVTQQQHQRGAMLHELLYANDFAIAYALVQNALHLPQNAMLLKQLGSYKESSQVAQ